MHEETSSWGDRLADRVADVYGSWKFFIAQNLFYAIWILLNVGAYSLKFDPWPWMGMNLIMSYVAANSGTIIQKSNNRQSQRDRIQAENDYATNLESERRIEELQKQLAAIELSYLKEIHAAVVPKLSTRRKRKK